MRLYLVIVVNIELNFLLYHSIFSRKTTVLNIHKIISYIIVVMNIKIIRLEYYRDAIVVEN